jgi:hypothetical protein
MQPHAQHPLALILQLPPATVDAIERLGADLAVARLRCKESLRAWAGRMDDLQLWCLDNPAQPRYVGALKLVSAGKGVSLRYAQDWLTRGFALSEDLPLVDIDSLALEIDSDYILSHRKGFNSLQLPGLPIKKARKNLFRNF